jgi:hypothetical protein
MNVRRWLQTLTPSVRGRTMRRLASIFLVTCLALIVLGGPSVYASSKLMAPPSIPALFRGRVTVNGSNVPAGTIITVGSAGVIYAQKETSMYAGSSVYFLNVPADNPDTPARDGATEGEVLEFAINGLPADQTAVWHSGGNSELNLTASGVLPTVPPSPTLTPTATPTITPTATPTPRLVYMPMILKQR